PTAWLASSLHGDPASTPPTSSPSGSRPCGRRSSASATRVFRSSSSSPSRTRRRGPTNSPKQPTRSCHCRQECPRPTELRRRLWRWSFLGPVLRVCRVVGRHEGPLAHTLDQAPALVGLQVVVVTAVAVEAVEGRAVGPGPVLAVVPLAGGGTATLD